MSAAAAAPSAARDAPPFKGTAAPHGVLGGGGEKVARGTPAPGPRHAHTPPRLHPLGGQAPPPPSSAREPPV